ncbi:hypothetical protein [Candidatus Phyllobacterium onerii]|uniref:hypothetical protein n=1 Tax=Candidatus Phyllobacterium onerii TaxID=3020828 RepID=UPI00232B18F9|nr:hypothetical protein [Phyllobacterium sp. IY22]
MTELPKSKGTERCPLTIDSHNTKMRLQPITRSDLDYVCLKLRESDKREIFGIRSHDNPLWIAAETLCVASYGKAAIAFYDGKPAAVIGVSPKPWPHVWDAWAYGTDDFNKVGLSLTRYALKVLKPYLLARQVHRLEAPSRMDHSQAHSWLRALGATDEAILRSYGRDGADYVMFSWTRK